MLPRAALRRTRVLQQRRSACSQANAAMRKRRPFCEIQRVLFSPTWWRRLAHSRVMILPFLLESGILAVVVAMFGDEVQTGRQS